MKQTAALEKLVTKQGRLINTLPQFDIQTILTAAQITRERRENTGLRNIWFWTGDSALYRVEDDKAVLYFGEPDTNLIFQNIEDAVNQIKQTNNYMPRAEDVERVIESATTGSTLRIKLSDLKLQKYDDEFCCFKIDTKKHDDLNPAQRELAERVYGQGKEFEKSMEILRKSHQRVKTTKIYVLNPEYVQKAVKHSKSKAIARACWLDFFYFNSDFLANVRIIDDNSMSLRGVPVVAEGDGAPKIKADPIGDAYNTLLERPEEALKRMTSERAHGLSKLVTTYLSNQAGQ